MATIPTYQKRFSQSGDLPMARATSAVSANSPIGDALSGLGRAGTDILNAIAFRREKDALEAKRLADEAQREADNIDNVTVSNALSLGDVHWQQDMTVRAEKWKVGDPAMSEGLGKDFGKWRDAQRSAFTTDKGRQFFDKQAGAMESRLQMAAFTFQKKATTGKLNADSAAGEQADENMVFNNPGRYEEVFRRGAETTIGRTDLDDGEKAKILDLRKRKLSLAAERGEFESNPGLWYQRRYGAVQMGPGGAQPGTESGVVVTPDGTVTLDTDKSLPAGMRNNNPANIKWAKQGDALGPSKNKDQGDSQAVYASPEEGVAAMYKLALKKFDGGKVTANQLIAGNGGWTPGNTAAAKNVAASMGLGPDDNMNLRDPAQLRLFARSLITQEQGAPGKQYSDQMLAQVAGDVLTGKAVKGEPTALSQSGAAPAKPPGSGLVEILPTAPATFRGMDYEQQIAMQNLAETRIKQDGAVFRASVESQIRDEIAANKDGKVGADIPDATLQAAFGIEFPRIKNELIQSRQMVADISAMKTQSEAEIIGSLKSSEPVVGPGYAAQDERQRIRSQAAQQVLKQRIDDPAGYATRNSAALKGQLAAIDDKSTQPADRPLMVQAYVRSNLAEQTRLGIAIPVVLTPRQSDDIAMRAIKATKPEDSANLIAGLESEYGEFFPKVFDQLVKENKISGELLIIPNIPTQSAREAVSRMARVKEADLTQGIESLDQKVVKDAVTESLARFVKTIAMPTQQAAGTVNAYEGAMRKLAYQFVQSGMSPSKAAEQANEMLLGQYKFEGTARYPKNADISKIQSGAGRALDNLGDIDVPKDLTGARKGTESLIEWTDTVRSRGQWFTRPDDGGLELWAFGKNGVRYRVTRGGKAVSYSWDDLATPQSRRSAGQITQ